MRLVPTGHLLFFASPKKSKQKKGDPDVQVWLRQTSITPHPFFSAYELVALRSPSDSARFFPKKECCVRLDVGERAVALNVCDGLTKKGSLKTGEWFSGCFLDGFCDGRDWAVFIIESYSEGSLKRVWSGDGSSPTASNRAWLICQDAKCRRAADAPLGWFSGCLWSRAGHSRLTIIDAA